MYGYGGDNMREFIVKIKPLTPIWTGDENRECKTLRETGMLGSLRWWYEALVRGLGGSACDSTSDNRCPDKDGNHCDVCELFGCMGWARKFRLEIESINLAVIPKNLKIKIGTRKKRVIRKREKYLIREVEGLMADGDIILKFMPLREISQNEWALLNKILQIIADYSALGAKTSQGSGVIKIAENNLPYKDENPKKSELKGKGNKINSPNLANFFFYKFHIKFKKGISNLIDKEVFWTHQSDHYGFIDNWENWKKLWSDYHFLPIAFHIRDAIRQVEDDKNKRHEIFGELGKGSKIFVSHCYKVDDTTVEVRVWGYDVEKSIKHKIKKELENKLKEKLFSKEEYKESLESCTLTEEKTGKEILGVVR
ncbi:MAG: type III-B CRISPR module RAMP protein Cmr1 [Canidatus Methanoxibalbensis ujae]|nr:type III-B CRISPR module RAMP protein Cmr1 [Candidatus Methanoxibalbensis ujae]